jgi:cell division protein FtsQ
MSETLILDTEEIRHSEDWKPFALKVSIGLLVFFLVAEFAFYMIVVPMTSRIRLTVSGSTTIGYDELCSAAGISGSEKWISFNTANVASRLAANPLFESVMVEKKFPDTVCVTVKERVPVAVTFGTINGRTVPIEIDQSGIAFRIGALPENNNLPLVTGITFENPVPGMRLNAQLKSLFSQLSDLESRKSLLLASISEIKIVQKTYGGYDLVVYPVHTPVRVRTDKALNEDALQYMMLVLDVVKDMKLAVDEIDIRAGTVAYRVKGEQL